MYKFATVQKDALKFASTNSNLRKSIISDMHHRITYMYINLLQIRVSRSLKTVHTNLFANNRKLHKFSISIFQLPYLSRF